MAKMQLEFDGFNEAIKRLEKLDGDIRKTTNDALIKSRRLVNKNVGTIMNKHNKTYRTIRTLESDSQPEWNATVASIEVGFDIHNGGLASIFLMYGTPRTKKDQKLYNAFYGKQTQKEIREIQEEIFMDEIRRHGG